jgi:CheY-like chemotaxis protein/CHASE3 domain sensor protein
MIALEPGHHMSKIARTTTRIRRPHEGLPLSPAPLAGFIIAVLAVSLIALFSYRSLQSSAATAARVTHTLDVLEQVEALLSSVKDAETGQRGYLLTGTETYLPPFINARAEVPGEIDRLRGLVADSPPQLQRVEALALLIKAKMDELGETVTLQRSGDSAGALAIVRTDRGKNLMDRIRAVAADIGREERTLLAARETALEDAVHFSSLLTWGGSAVLLALILAAAFMTSRDYRARETETWLRAGQMGLANRMQGERRIGKLGDSVLEFLSTYLGARVGAIYIAEADGRFRRVSTYAMPEHAPGEVLRSGDGLLGQAAKENRAIHVTDVPADYLDVNSSLGRGKPREILIAPATADGVVHAVVELGFFHSVHASERELMARASESLGIAVRTSNDRSRLEELLEETQRQAEELQAQQEELRVSNEELEEQGRGLKESQVRLEEQHAELEQTNTQLEAQAELLETQKDNLSAAQERLRIKAADLERSNQYKSEFLANMSHELRTPLNSTLILAKLLAENKKGNLAEDQVKFAQTIYAAGNDLLVLINDILDLSKIESGKVELDVESVRLSVTIEALAKGMQPIAREKGLGFGASVEPGTPERVQTDAQRLGQILRNLVSNALKFTAKGAVSLRVYSTDGKSVSFAVRDTGIGIPAHQHEIIFEAFRQADGSTHRKYGGTGLGLSISRDLARLLGGDIAVQSREGEGSTFTLTLPVVYAGTAPPSGARRSAETAQAAAAELATSSAATHSPETHSGTAPRPVIDDDREQLVGGSRLILVIEDDVRFASILRDLAHELGFQCIIAHSAQDGLASVRTYRPSAILLDINLPDQSGLTVLDQLKRNPDSRHIPVHVASVADYAREALERGAIGYALKPVARAELVVAFQRLEAKFSQGLRRVLVVEDDERQRESIRQLLSMGDVQITDVKTAAGALEQLQTTTFDCVVMDFNLPDLSGYELLEQMSQRDNVSFPPVIVYTGRSLTRDEEHSLRRFANSIIIKGARSPERLLDEVTLFLHQVEAKLPVERQRMLKVARARDTALEGRRILVVEDDVRNIFALSSVLEPQGAHIEIARNGREALDALERGIADHDKEIDLVLMDIMMPEMDGITAMQEIRKRAEWKKLPIIALTAKAMKDDQERCLAAGANDYMAKPLDVEKLLSLVRVWIPK